MPIELFTLNDNNTELRPRALRTKLFTSCSSKQWCNLAPWLIIVVSILVPLLFPGPFVNRFVKPKVIEAFGRSYPHHTLTIGDMSYSVWKDEFHLESVAVNTERGVLIASMQSGSLSGLGLKNLMFGRDLSMGDLDESTVYATELVMNFGPSSYELRCGEIRCSVADSTLVMHGIEVYPSGGDKAFFASNKYRRTRFEVAAGQFSITGADLKAMMSKEHYRARTVLISDVNLGVLVNKDKRSAPDSSEPLMPSRMLASVEGDVQVDSISVMNAAIVYGEQIISGRTPAVITIGDLHLSVKGLTNRRSIATSISIRAGGTFMRSAAMDLFMLIPVESPTFSYRFAGSVGSMDLRSLNTFLERAELIRITEGSLQMATFDVLVNNGSAQGNVRAFYKDLSLASLSKATGEEENIISGFTMFLANAFVIRGSNIPDRTGVIKVGKVGYAKKKGEAFLEYTWFALRSGLKDVVGF